MPPERFDKFTERARRVLTFAQEEAMRLNHTTIGPEHLLLGLVREGDGVAAKVLANLGIELNKLRAGVEFLIGRGERATLGEIGLTSAGKEIIRLSVVQAKSLGQHYIGTEHILLGLLVFPEENVASQILNQFGVELEAVRKETERILAQSIPGPLSGLPGKKRAKIEKAVADSLVAFDKFDVAADNPARLEFDTISAELSDSIVREIKRERGWPGFLHFLVDMVGENSRIDEIWRPGTEEAEWFRYINDNIWMPLLIEFSNLHLAQIEKAQTTVDMMAAFVAQLKRAKT